MNLIDLKPNNQKVLLCYNNIFLNIINLYKKKKNLNLGLLIPSTFTFKKILDKSKKKYVKFLVLEKKFLREKRLNKLKKKTYFYTIRDKKLFNQFKNKNLIFENL